MTVLSSVNDYKAGVEVRSTTSNMTSPSVSQVDGRTKRRGVGDVHCRLWTLLNVLMTEVFHNN